MSEDKKPNPQDWFGSVIGLKIAISELAKELAIDTIQENPRLFSLAIDGLKAKIDRLEEAMKADMNEG